MRRHIGTILIAALLLGMMACSSGSVNYTGTWVNEIAFSKTVLIINNDGTATVVDALGKTSVLNWELQKETLLLKDPRKAGDQGTVKLSDDNQSLMLTVKDQSLLFLRQGAKPN